MSRIAPALLVVSFAATCVSVGSAEACSCLPTPGIEHVYASATHVVRVQIRREVRRVHRRLRGIPSFDGEIQVYRARVRESYKGCMRRGRILKLMTAKDSGLCGAVLDLDQEYVLALGDGERNAFQINSCGFIRLAGSLSPAEAEFLDTRHQCCGRRCECSGTDLVSCLVDPCSIESCGDATCVSNYCGGCNAEFFDPTGQPVCTPCENGFDCGSGQTCEGGLCVPEATCAEDTDCPTDAWCRPSETGGSACTPFLGPGETCGGFAPAWAFERCAPDLTCETPARLVGESVIADLRGVCTPS